METSTTRPAPTAADYLFGAFVDALSAAIDCAVFQAQLAHAFHAGLAIAQAQRPTGASARATRAAANREGLPLALGRRETLTASQRRDAEAKRQAEALGLTGPTHAARDQQTTVQSHADQVFANIYAKFGHPGRNV